MIDRQKKEFAIEKKEEDQELTEFINLKIKPTKNFWEEK